MPPRPALVATRSKPLKGAAAIPPDKSISHRALILGALANGETRIANLLEAEDVTATAGALRALGAGIARDGGGVWRVRGVGTGGFAEPSQILDLGNSGTGARLLMGAVATTPIACLFTGDDSLRARPMERVLAPLRRFGATHRARREGYLPLTLAGAADPMPIVYRSPVPSAQVKSAVLLAALNAPGETTFVETARTRDHTERLLHLFGAKLARTQTQEGDAITVTGEAELKAARLTVPGDPSSAAFPLVAALIVPDSEIRLTNVMLNETRSGLLAALREMGASVEIQNQREQSGETVADLVVRSSELKGVDVPPDRAPAMIDEYPALCVAACFAKGRTIMRGLGELRFKESDRLSALAQGLTACGVKAAVEGDTLAIEGSGGVAGGARIAARSDHRIAMAFLVLGLSARAPVAVEGTESIATSFPDFVSLMTGLGATIKQDA